ncbi:MAG: DUF1559 domain-containing protein, partial [Planctomycetaceae bacterium]|nr:DUF1559 domain-containing protein [Planctomycetaceae bacterium]
PPEMKTDENGYRLIVKAIGLQSDVYRSPRDAKLSDDERKAREEKRRQIAEKQVYEKLGLDPNQKPTLVYQDPYSFTNQYIQELNKNEVSRDPMTPAPASMTGHPENDVSRREIENKMMTSWTAEELPMMKEWLDQVSPALDVIGEAVRKPAFCIPVARVPELDFISAMLPMVQTQRSFARALQVRSAYRVATGDIDGTIDDAITCHRLGRHITRQGNLIMGLVGIAIEGIGAAQGIASNLDHQPTKEQLQRWLAELDQLPARATLKEIMNYERLYGLQAMQSLAMHEYPSPQDYDEIPPVFNSPMMRTFDFNIVMQKLNELYDAIGNETPLPDGMELGKSQGFRMYNYNFLSRKARSENFFRTLAVLFVPAVQAAREAIHRVECVSNMQRITIAMLLYHADHGTLPPACTVDANGKPLQSWRVLLLPYLGEKEKALFAQIRLDEPWDSEHNRQFHDKMPAIYQCPTTAKKNGNKPGETNYTVIVGDKTPFDRSGSGKKLSDFGPESADMVLVTETRQAVNWMNPASDVTFEQAKTGINGTPENPCAIGSWHSGGCNVGLRSGAMDFISESTSQDVWEKMLTGTGKSPY